MLQIMLDDGLLLCHNNYKINHATEANMNNPHRTLAEIHKFSINPANQRTLDELESYYHNLAHGSPLARAFSEIAAEDRANAVSYTHLDVYKRQLLSFLHIKSRQ